MGDYADKAKAPGEGAASKKQPDVAGADEAAKGQSAELKKADGGPRWLRRLGSKLEGFGHGLMGAVGLESKEEANLGQAEAFTHYGTYGPKDIVPSTGIGGFEASYEPLQALIARIRVAMDYADGLTVDASGNVTPAEPDLQGAADQAAALPAGPRRAAFLAKFQWSDAEKTQWATDMATKMEEFWGGKHGFFIDRPQWEWIGARVDVDIDQREEKAGDEHMDLHVVKMPQGQDVGAYVSSNKDGGWDTARDQYMFLSSQDLNPSQSSLLRLTEIEFGVNDDALDAVDEADLESFIRTYEGDPSKAASVKPKVKLEVYASAGEADAAALNQRRAAAIIAHLKAKGFTEADSRITIEDKGKGGSSQRVALVVDGGEGQNVAAHEFGHAFGLADEYATTDKTGAGGMISGTGGQAGGDSGHNTQASDMRVEGGGNLPGSIHENSGNIMSLGNALKPQHYATFHDALQQLTGVEEWTLGDAKAKPDLSKEKTLPAEEESLKPKNQAYA